MTMIDGDVDDNDDDGGDDDDENIIIICFIVSSLHVILRLRPVANLQKTRQTPLLEIHKEWGLWGH